MEHNYCTIFSRDSLYKGLILYDSLIKYDKSFCLFAICLEEDIRALLVSMNLPNMAVIGMSNIENEDYELAMARYNRNLKEFAWTAKAPMILYIFKYYPDIPSLIYIDGDTKFFSSPLPIFQEFSNYSVMLTRERFYIPDKDNMYRLYGSYNGGFLAFKRDHNAIEALQWFRKKCLQWCYNRSENGLYGDQIYLDSLPKMFKNVVVTENIGINATAWHSHASIIDKQNDVVRINNVPIIFYHYSGLVYYNLYQFELCFYIDLPQNLINLIYVPYLMELRQKIWYVEQFRANFYNSTIKIVQNGFYRNYYQLL
ncbi:hypothetical protein [Clostridium pasteurianum]|uniref:Nucleotide-diphospho-sugar transferase n=1 Tax=Clostridium pasteurianum BC1 TaxID=86416 RepID=R4K5Q1_CLOPA|nr:hypothetical protein [Clostridium pasteurianum]AGK97903.1 hypothetical protein Clopa_3078 [Clostridium pasteurianum BC1]